MITAGNLLTRWSAQSIVLRDFAAKTIDSTDLLNLDHPLQEKTAPC